jgi:putative phosphoribosyl transferase
MNPPFADRAEAARALAEAVVARALPAPVVVLALPRGGVPIGAELAWRLHAPLDLLLVRKIGAPWEPELAIAAVVDGTVPDIVFNDEVMALSRYDPDYIETQVLKELQEIQRRRRLYLRGRAPVALGGVTVVVVDDGIATGTTLRVALRALRRQQPARLVLAVPVAPHEVVQSLRGEVDDVICLVEPKSFYAIGRYYRDFHPVSDDEVIDALDAASAALAEAPPMSQSAVG